MTHTPATVSWSEPGAVTDYRYQDAQAPHPSAYCACGKAKLNVQWAACSAVCAAAQGLPVPPMVAARRHWETWLTPNHAGH